ncbi:FtsK/SpoIIIE domain-containing protein [Buchananella felis]|uniref:FtsK/SpoIIIE domain-containing protein n=1 Tax=Buchananella felis TaxID=3231492 RepID=UPI003529B578
MRIKLTLRGRGPADIDLVVTADSTATVGDIAATLATAGPEGAAPARDPESLTLRLLDPVGGRVTSVLSSTSYVTETGLRSGALVDIVGAEQASSTGVAAAELRVVGGPDKGRRIALPFGATILGRSAKCGATVNDPMVSKQHARITVGAGIEIQDLNSANGVVMGEQRVERARVNPGDLVTLGASTVQIVQLRAPEVGSADSTDIAFVRPPQVIPHVAVKKFKLPQAPERPQPTRFPVVAMLMPLVMGAAMYAMTRQLYSVIFVALSPLMMIGAWWDQKRQGKKAEKAARKAFEESMALTRKSLQGQHDLDREARHSQFPPVEQMIGGAIRRDGALWLRRPEHPEFLKLRLGIGTARAAVEFDEANEAKGLPDCVEAVNRLRNEFTFIHDVPVVADLRAEGSLGLFGDRKWLEQAQAAITAQIATQYSPAEVVLACLTTTSREPAWKWVEWLPHVSSPHSPLGAVSHLSADQNSGAKLLEVLEGLLDARRGKESKKAEGVNRSPRAPGEGRPDTAKIGGALPAVIVMVDGTDVDRARLNRLVESGPDYGIHFVWSDENFEQIPAACRSFVAVEQSEASVGDVVGSQILRPVKVDMVSRDEVNKLARSLAPVMDAGVPVNDDSDLPGSISFVSLTGKELADSADAAVEHWRGTGSVIDRSPGAQPVPGPAVSLRALIGQGGTGPMHLDLRTQGPHALVGGTTGAGKSEFLQAWVLGMAQAVSPDRLTFLFVDYKGGSAFARCTELPHCVGLVTDLSPYLVRRALTSLRAELHYREHLLNEKGAKDLVTLEKRGDPDCPPSLVIVVDEFAALVGEVPEFVDGVVDVAQRGRSLGLHLILATQRPAGVIKDNLRANTNLRVALRMADTEDSKDVLGDEMAAHFPQGSPGRGAAKTGPGRIATFQSAYPGAKTSDEVQAVAVDVEGLGFGDQKKWHTAELPKPGGDVETDIDRVVATLQKAAEVAAIPAPRKPWLPDLAPTYDIAKLLQRRDSELILGVIDVPEKQAQVAEYFLPDKEGNIAYYGASGSGKTSALRSLAVAAAITPRSGPVHVYGIDFAGGGLDMLKVMQHVGDVVPGDDEERVTRLINMLAGIVNERSVRYSAAHAGDITAYRRLSGKEEEPRILLLVDGMGAFYSTYQGSVRLDRVWTAFQQVLLDGRAVGVHVAVTADRSQSVPNSIASNFQRKVVLRQTEADAYYDFGLPKDVLDATSLPGRAMQVGRPDLMQLAILGDNVNALAQAREMGKLAKSAVLKGRARPKPIESLPPNISAEKVPTVVGGLPVIGVESEHLQPMPFQPSGTLTVGGAPQTGRTNTLKWLFASFKTAYPNAVFLHAANGRSELATLPGWHAKARGADEIAEMLQGATEKWEQEAQGDAPGVVLFIESIGAYSYGVADDHIANAIRSAKANGHLVVAEGDLTSFQQGGSLSSAMRGGRCGLVLCPDVGDGDLVTGVTIPAMVKQDLLPGRGYFTKGGQIWKVQVPRL